MGRKKQLPLSEAGYSQEEILREAARIMRARNKTPPNPKKLSPCPKCGELKGVAEMRIHKPRCEGKK